MAFSSSRTLPGSRNFIRPTWLRRIFFRLHFALTAKLREQVFGQNWNIFGAFTQRRHNHRHYVQPVIEILREMSRLTACARSCWWPRSSDVYEMGRAPPAARTRALAELEEFDLQRRAISPISVQKHYPSVSHLNRPFSFCSGRLMNAPLS